MNKELGKKKIVKFTDLDAWQEAHKLVLKIYEMTKKFPREEMFGLINRSQKRNLTVLRNKPLKFIKLPTA